MSKYKTYDVLPKEPPEWLQGRLFRPELDEIMEEISRWLEPKRMSVIEKKKIELEKIIPLSKKQMWIMNHRPITWYTIEVKEICDQLGQVIVSENPIRPVDVELILLHITAMEHQVAKDIVDVVSYKASNTRPYSFNHPEDKEPYNFTNSDRD